MPVGIVLPGPGMVSEENREELRRWNTPATAWGGPGRTEMVMEGAAGGELLA